MRETFEEIGLESKYLDYCEEFSDSFVKQVSKHGIYVDVKVFVLDGKVGRFLVDNFGPGQKITSENLESKYFKINQDEVDCLFYTPLENFLKNKNLSNTWYWECFENTGTNLVQFDIPNTPMIWGLTAHMSVIAAIKLFGYVPEWLDRMEVPGQYSDVIEPDLLGKKFFVSYFERNL